MKTNSTRKSAVVITAQEKSAEAEGPMSIDRTDQPWPSESDDIVSEIPAKAANTKPSGSKRRRQRGDDVRGRVLGSALQCFSAFGFEGTSTREVAARAGVTHTLVLYHFLSKEQLWHAAFEQAMQGYATAVSPVFEAVEGASAAEALRKFIDVFVRQAASKPEIYRIIFNEGNVSSERLNWIVRHFLRDHFKSVCHLIRLGQAEGTVRQCDVARLYYMIMMMGGSLPAIATEYKELTGRSVASESEVLRNTAFIYELVFVD